MGLKPRRRRPTIDSATYDKLSTLLSDWNMEVLSPVVDQLLYDMAEELPEGSDTLDAIFNGDARGYILRGLDDALDDVDSVIARCEKGDDDGTQS